MAATQWLSADQLMAAATEAMVLSRINHTVESTEEQWLAILG